MGHRGSPRTLALFDFDGTLTTVGTFPKFCRYVVSYPRLVLGGLLISPWLIGYQLGLVSDRRICAILAKPTFLGQSRDRIDAQYANRVRHVGVVLRGRKLHVFITASATHQSAS